MFLHEHSKFNDLIEVISFERDIPPAIVEKDYWVMHVLMGLSKSGFIYYFKGGTSLSKAFNIIQRFSEDIDIKIDPPADVPLYAGKNQDKPKHRESRQRYFEWIVRSIDIPGIIVGSHAAADSKMRSYHIELEYQSLAPRDSIVKRYVLLELGFAKTTPFEPKDISSWCFERATEAGLQVEDNRAKSVLVYPPEYTLIEKLDAIHRRFERDRSPAEWVRHYYDVFELLRLPRVHEFIGSPCYQAYLCECFGDEAGQLAELPAFKLDDPDRLAALTAAYETEKGLYCSRKEIPRKRNFFEGNSSMRMSASE